MKKLLLTALLLLPSFAYAQDRAALTTQVYQGQVTALDGANKLCQMDVTDVKNQLDATNADAADLKKQLDAANADAADLKKQLDVASSEAAALKKQLDAIIAVTDIPESK